ncbi:hypothetical protein O3Q51_05975 [Cryomorphaceae bacterium 1068]|nr:hypothetical protein [Cryomorphaceae bacterium 1068]
MNNVCECPNPPGGKVVCEPHQMAVCIVENGQQIQRCLDPVTTYDSVSLVSWALEEITGEFKKALEISSQDLLTLVKGEYHTQEKSVKFHLPESVSSAVLEMIKENGNLGSGFNQGGNILIT